MFPIDQKLFQYQGLQLRTITIDKEPWFVAKDVCEILELDQVSRAVSRLDDDEVTTSMVIDSLGREQETNVINEPGLYSMILTSRKKEAKSFKRWITHDVIPSIRKSGSYSITPLDEKQSLIAAMKLSTLVAEETEQLKGVTAEHGKKILQLERKVDEQITLQHHEQRALQKNINRRVCELAEREDIQQLCFDVDEVIKPDISKIREKLYRNVHRDLKDAFAVASYRDVKRCDFKDSISYVASWRPRLPTYKN